MTSTREAGDLGDRCAKAWLICTAPTHHKAHRGHSHGQEIVSPIMRDHAALARAQRAFQSFRQRISADRLGFDEALLAALDFGDEDRRAPVQPFLVHALEKFEPHQSSLST